MAASNSVAYTFRKPARSSLQRQLCLCLSLLLVLPGCGGCGCQPAAKTQAELEKELEERARRVELEKERLKPPLDVGPLTSEPYDPRQKTSDFYYKPGHWASAMFLAKANHDDINGDLELAVLDSAGQPLGLTGTPYTLSTQRTVALPKKQPKRLESQVYLPAGVEKARVVPQISARRGGRIYEGPPQSARMPAHQYYFVVLARWPERYTYLEQIDSCHLPKNLGLENNEHNLYRVILQQAEKQTTLPAYSLFWTSTAAILWDDAEPDALSSDQKTALLDWLHWGGQLIISGPDSLGTLKTSFLAPFLPATGGAARPLEAAELQDLSRHWPLQEAQRPVPTFPLKPAHPWQGITLERHPEAGFVPGTGELVAERRVGRGRVVITAFPLNGSDVTGWRGFDAFFNACLLGHPGRTFADNAEGGAKLCWRSGEEIRDPRRLSQLRYFTRDTGRKFVAVKEPNDASLAMADEVLAGPPPTDVASWCDSNEVARLARGTLKDAARIEIPSPLFVVGIVTVYLIVLVPLNWLIFRVLDRIEWAWVAAPLIAVACTGLVIRLAQLDIGFARSATELAVVELQGHYARAHVTRYAALYTSLSTEYRFHADDPGALVLPFPNRLDDSGIRFGRTNLLYRYGEHSDLSGVRVLSNSTGLVHSEQMLDLHGGCALVKNSAGLDELVNDTDLPLRGAGVLRLDEQNHLFTAWFDELAPHSHQTLSWDFHTQQEMPPEKKGEQETPHSPWHFYRESRPETAQKQGTETNASRTSGTLNVRELLDLAEKDFLECPTRRPGDVRLIAWTEAAVPGLAVEPAAPQVRRIALVVADLEHGPLPSPDSDTNTRRSLEVPARVLKAE